MAAEKIHIEQFLELANSGPVLDVRSPAEYNHAHIPGAHSFPLFTDEERKVVGTTYKQQSRQAAIKIGLDLFGPKMRRVVEEAESIVSNWKLPIGNDQTTDNNDKIQLPTANRILVHCWRGGMRSAAIAWLLDLYGFKV
ncbi:MAG: rhodanese-like domain-containing protein, partial [Flavitalea sp.]